MRLPLTALALILLAGRTVAAQTASSPWDDYQIIIYQEQTPLRWEGLRALGVTAGKVIGLRNEADAGRIARDVAPLLQAKMPWYVENIATDLYAAYHRWTLEHPNEVNWRFLALQARHRRDRSDRSVFLRDPSLSDPAWFQRIRDRLSENVRLFAPYRPLYYNLADESGIADLAAAWDFDFSPPSLTGFRAWLRTQYTSFDALNAEWGTHFAAWDEIVPLTTTEAMQRADQNFSQWADFKAWMDESFARAVRTGTDALHAADPAAVAAIEGAQVPGWGGYDYTRLASAVDLMEISGGSTTAEIARALNPSLIFLTASFGGGGEEHRIWHELLLGGRGLIIWDENHDFVDDQGRPGPRARAVAPLYARLRAGLGAQLIAARPRPDPAGILYSPASFHTFWMLSQRLKGDAWTQRSSGQEAEDNALRAAMRNVASSLAHLGIAPRFLSSAQIDDGALDSLRVLLLPHAIALSDATLAAIRAFTARGGLVLADVEPGIFDAHSRRRAAPPLADLRGGGIEALPDTVPAMQQVLKKAGATAPMEINHADGSPVTDVEVRLFDVGPVLLIALQRDWPGAQATPETINLALPAKRLVRNLHDGTAVATDTLTIALDAVAPTLLAVSSEPLPPPTVTAAATDLHLTAAAGEVLHLDITDNSGVVRYSANPLLRTGSAVWPLPDGTGHWTVRARGVLSGAVASVPLDVR